MLDSRLATASYRWELVRALPPMRRTKSRREAEEFLAKLAADAVVAEALDDVHALLPVGSTRTMRSR